MLILTRKVNQKLIINDNIEVVILESYKNTVKIGVNAPNDVQIYREEIYNEIKKSNKQAQSADIDAISNLKPKNNIQSFNLMKKIEHNDKP
ncbi:MAG: carbon storage regulator CsrA [Candidatus Gastranaerophilales bacterium]|nr:carbon storage regulator CsrA [Candidatus Gastranaerophilales bacterium]